MITPRRTRLVRVPDLNVYRRAIASLATETSAPRTLVIVPTQAAADVLSDSWRESSTPSDAVTRDQLYGRLHAALPTAPPWLSSFERDALMQAAAVDAEASVGELPFRVRPGLVVEILRFYDQLRRQSQSVRRFEELMMEALGGVGDLADRGAERLLRQTRFLVRAFENYEQRVAASGACDEHTLRAQLLAEPTRPSVRHIVVTVPDWIADPAGLFVADFELLARLPGLEQIDLVATTALLGSGFHQRLHEWWPGLEELEAEVLLGPVPTVRPRLARPASGDVDQLWTTHRDRHQELAAIAGRLSQAPPEPRAAVVFKHPLPYIYLAPEIFGSANVPYRVYDALPLAAEPAVAVIDLVLDTLESDFARTALIALIGSPYLRLPERSTSEHGGSLEPAVSGPPEGAREDQANTPAVEFGRQSIDSLNRTLSDRRYLGGIDRLTQLSNSIGADAEPAYDTAIALARALVPLLEPAPASRKLKQLVALLAQYFPPVFSGPPEREGDDLFEDAPKGSLTERERRARVTVDEMLEELAEAHAAHHDPLWTLEDLAASVRRWIGDRLSSPPDTGAGVSLLDDQAARYGEFDDVTVVGLVETDWPERSRRNIFYTPTLLKSLGWPSERDRRAADTARFLDLIASATTRVELSTFTLDDETLVSRSVLLDEVPRAKLSTMVEATETDASPAPAAAPDPARSVLRSGASEADDEWATLRAQQPPASDPEFHGSIGGWTARSWSVGGLETYLACPFKFFAQHVLRLEEEPDDEEIMDPRRQGQFVHEVFETFFHEWQDAGHKTITMANLETARRLFESVVERALSKLPEGDRALERSRLLGSSAAAGLGEAVFRMEAERAEPVVERLLEHSLSGTFTIAASDGSRRVVLRGKADRIDLLADGTFRVIDYKLGWPPDRTKALQLPIYSLCAEQQLAGRHRRQWTTGEAVYLAFKGPKRVVPLFTSADQRAETLARAQQRLLDTIDAIERGEFPPSPDDVFRCESCSFSAVCRKDYVGPV